MIYISIKKNLNKKLIKFPFSSYTSIYFLNIFFFITFLHHLNLFISLSTIIQLIYTILPTFISQLNQTTYFYDDNVNLSYQRQQHKIYLKFHLNSTMFNNVQQCSIYKIRILFAHKKSFQKIITKQQGEH